MAVFDGLGDAHVARKSWSAREQHEQFIVLTGADRLFRRDVVRRGVEQARAFEHSGRIGEPDRIPVGLDLTRGGPARTCAPIEILKRRRIQKQCFQWHMVSLYFSILRSARTPLAATTLDAPRALFRTMFRTMSKTRKPLLKYALAGLKRQNNLAERRFWALRRENRVVAGSAVCNSPNSTLGQL